jgi:hypothetical protein
VEVIKGGFLFIYRKANNLGIVTHTYTSSTWEAEARGLRVRGQFRPHGKTLSQKKKKMLKGRKGFFGSQFWRF